MRHFQNGYDIDTLNPIWGFYDYSMPTDTEYLQQIQQLSDVYGYTEKLRYNSYSDNLKIAETERIPLAYRRIYYLHTFFPKDNKWHTHNGGKLILDYKDKDPNAVSFFTLELEAAIDAFLSTKIPARPVHLVAVPSSKVGQRSAVADSIKTIVARYHKFQLVDESELIKRTKSIPKLSQSTVAARDPNKLLLSMECGTIIPDDTYIVLDDIVTTGSTFEACQILLSSNYENTYFLAIGKTGRWSASENVIWGGQLVSTFRDEKPYLGYKRPHSKMITYYKIKLKISPIQVKQKFVPHPELYYEFKVNEDNVYFSQIEKLKCGDMVWIESTPVRRDKWFEVNIQNMAINDPCKQIYMAPPIPPSSDNNVTNNNVYSLTLTDDEEYLHHTDDLDSEV